METKALYEKVLERRASRLGVSLADAAKPPARESLPEFAAELAANRLRSTPQDVLKDDLRRMETSTYPSPECLVPDDIEEILEDLDQKQLGIEALFEAATLERADLGNTAWRALIPHLTTCDSCRTLLAASRPNAKRMRDFKEFVRKQVLPAEAVAEK